MLIPGFYFDNLFGGGLSGGRVYKPARIREVAHIVPVKNLFNSIFHPFPLMRGGLFNPLYQGGIYHHFRG